MTAALASGCMLGLSSPADTDIVTPNNDTPYSYAWVDLRAEPWVLTMPKIEPKRFYTSQWDDSGLRARQSRLGDRRQRRPQLPDRLAVLEGRPLPRSSSVSSEATTMVLWHV